jgi:nucleoside 2-deoxyribosyltransferase
MLKKAKMIVRPKPRLYFAAPLFNDPERLFNKEVTHRLGSYFDVFLPQEDGGLIANMIAEGTHPAEAAERVFRLDIEAMIKCDVLLIILDGRTVDEGAAFELGYAFALGKECYGLQTDMRRLLSTGNNPMVDCALRHIFQSVEELMVWASDFVRITPVIFHEPNTVFQQNGFRPSV